LSEVDWKLHHVGADVTRSLKVFFNDLSVLRVTKQFRCSTEVCRIVTTKRKGAFAKSFGQLIASQSWGCLRVVVHLVQQSSGLIGADFSKLWSHLVRSGISRLQVH